jgi:hypothetical protein
MRPSKMGLVVRRADCRVALRSRTAKAAARAFLRRVRLQFPVFAFAWFVRRLRIAKRRSLPAITDGEVRIASYDELGGTFLIVPDSLSPACAMSYDCVRQARNA